MTDLAEELDLLDGEVTSPWDPEEPVPVVPPEVRRKLQDMEFNRRERARIAAGADEPPVEAEDVQAPTPVPQVRVRRVGIARSRVIDLRRVGKTQLALWTAEAPPERPGVDYDRPANRNECRGGERPCPFVSCMHHLYLDVSPTNGAIQFNFPGLDVDDLAETCAIDIADRGGVALEVIGSVLNVTRERSRQIVVKALRKIRRALERVAVEANFNPAGEGVDIDEPEVDRPDQEDDDG